MSWQCQHVMTVSALLCSRRDINRTAGASRFPASGCVQVRMAGLGCHWQLGSPATCVSTFSPFNCLKPRLRRPPSTVLSRHQKPNIGFLIKRHQPCSYNVSAHASSMRQTEFTFVNNREQSLVGTEFLPDSNSWATLIWHHGVCEHSGRYTPVFKHLADAGVAVYTYDVHGHGRSEPKEDRNRGLITDYTHLVDDLYTFVGAVEQRVGGRLPAASTFLGGQSMGGLVVALACLRCQERWAGLIVFSGAMGVVWTHVLRAQAAVGNLMAALIPRQQLVPAVKPENLHPDPAVVRAFKEDPLIFHGDLRTATGNQLLKAMKHLAKHRSKISLPVYAVHGTKDAVTSLDAIEEFTGGVSSKELQLVKVEGGYHEMLMGDERTGSAEGMMAWMRQRLERPWQQQEQQEDRQQQQQEPAAGGDVTEHACNAREGAAAEAK